MSLLAMTLTSKGFFCFLLVTYNDYSKPSMFVAAAGSHMASNASLF